jgi:D-amino-acid oxidase
MGSPNPVLVVNCTSLQASELGGVDDKCLKPMLGQLVIVENEVDGIYGISGDDDMDVSLGECCYVIPRPGGGGTAIGGCSFASHSRDPNMKLAERMMKRAISIAPGLVPKDAGIEALRVIRHQVGWRPHREGGPRVERETISDQELGPVDVVHAYGFGGFGFQSSYGVAAEVVDLVRLSLSAQKDV